MTARPHPLLAWSAVALLGLALPARADETGISGCAITGNAPGSRPRVLTVSDDGRYVAIRVYFNQFVDDCGSWSGPSWINLAQVAERFAGRGK